MDANMDIDRFLSRVDFMMLAAAEWPWKITHFILSANCVNCGLHTNSSLPSHFTIYKRNMAQLLNELFFWCRGCDFMAIYDHYPSDECRLCN